MFDTNEILKKEINFEDKKKIQKKKSFERKLKLKIIENNNFKVVEKKLKKK